MHLALTLANDPRLLPGADSLLRATLAETPLAPDDAAALADLAFAAVDHAVRTAYPAGEAGEVELTLCEEHGQLELRIRDDGLPQNVHALERRVHHADAAHAADEMHWHALGAQGKSLQLIKHLPTPHIGDSMPTPGEDPLQWSGTPGALAADAPLAPPQQYAIRRLRPEDAVQVSQLMYRTYGSTYFNEDVYYPHRITHQNNRQSLLSIVAAGEDGRIVGHCALERRPDSPIAELGQAAVDPAHRGRGLLDQLKAAAQAEAASLGLVGWFADAVTVHQFTQQSNAHHGGHVCGVDLAVSPQTESFRNIEAALSQRVSCILYFHWIDQPQPRTVFIPSRHQEIAAAIYQNLGCPVKFGQGAAPAADHGKLTVSMSRRAALAAIRVAAIGQDTPHAIRHAGRELIERARAEVVAVELPLNDPAAANVCEDLEKEAYAFTGLGPHFSTAGDVLKLTYLVKPLARAPIKTFEAFADKIVNYALAEQQRVRSNL